MQHETNIHNLGYADLHNHLYGCLSAEMLYNIGKQNPNPRWKVFTDLYEKVYGKTISTNEFFNEYNTIDKFADLYYFKKPGPFLEFQVRFNLIIALVQFTLKEMEEVAYEVASQHYKEGVHYAEYRIMFSKDESRDMFCERIRAVCRGLKRVENSFPMQTRVAMSLHRDGNFEENYSWLKELMEEDPLVRNYLVAIDFCYVEEGYPPLDKKDFFQKVLKDNSSQPSTALAILYHVGESYNDKTPFSAARWVLESSEYGAHRLGHCIALGIHPNVYLGQTRKESLSERLAQLNFELERYEEIKHYGDYYPKPIIESERKKILSNYSINTIQNSNYYYPVQFSEKECAFLFTFQEYCMDRIKKTYAVIESCPTSNYNIGMIPSPDVHPLSRFVKNHLKVTIGSDDPGILHTNINIEYQKAKDMGIDEFILDNIKRQSFNYKSSILSGRT